MRSLKYGIIIRENSRPCHPQRKKKIKENDPAMTTMVKMENLCIRHNWPLDIAVRETDLSLPCSLPLHSHFYHVPLYFLYGYCHLATHELATRSAKL